MKCKFEETLNEMKTELNKLLSGKRSKAAIDVLQGKLKEISKVELDLRKLQGTARIGQVEVKVERPKVEKKREPLLKNMNGAITDQKGNATVDVTNLEMLKDVSRDLKELLKDKQTRSLADEKVYNDGFDMLEKAGIEFKPFKLRLMKQIAKDGGLGEHNTKAGTIKIATGEKWGTDPQHVVLHEYIHRLTSENLDKYPVLRRKVKALREYIDKNIEDADRWYGLSDDYELLAEAMSNPEFQRELSKLPPFEGKSVFENLKKIVQALLDRLGSKERSALTDVVELTIQVAKAKEDVVEGKKEETALEKYQRTYGGTDDISWMQEDEESALDKYMRVYGGTDDISWLEESKEKPKQNFGKIDVTDPIQSMKVLKERKLQKEKDMQRLWMIGAEASMDRNVRTYNTWKEKEAEWLKSNGYPVPTRLVTGKYVPDEYYNGMDYLIEQLVNPSVETISDLTKAIVNGNKLTFGEYDHSKNVITKYDYSNESIKKYLENEAVRDYVDQELSDVGIEEQAVLEVKLKENKEFMDLLVGTHKNNEKYMEMWANYLANRNPIMVSHELVHAGSSKYVIDNPNSELTKNMEELYKKALENEEHINEVTGGDKYWKTNVHEFVAEGLTNPLVMKALAGIKHKEGKVSVFKELVDIALKMLGFSSGTVYSELLTSYLQVVKEQKEFSPEVKEMAKKILQGTEEQKDIKVLNMVEYPNRQAEQVMNKIHDEQYRSVRNTLDGIVTSIVNPTMVTSGINTLLNYTLEEKLITAGTYDPRTNVVTMSTLTEEQADSKARDLMLDKYMKVVYGKVPESDEEYVSKVDALMNDSKYKDVIKQDMQDEAADMIMRYVQAKGSHAISHELIHAGAVNYMRENPESELTKNVNELFEVAKKYYEATKNKINEDAPYWLTDVDEFLAETLTNPATIKYMNKIQVGKTIRPVSVFQDLIRTVLKMLGMKPEDTVYQAALHSYMGILEQVAMNKQREKELMNPEKYDQERTDKLKNALDKGELDEFPSTKQYVKEKIDKQVAVKKLLQGLKDC